MGGLRVVVSAAVSAACIAACGGFSAATEDGVDGGAADASAIDGAEPDAGADGSHVDAGQCLAPTCDGETSCLSWNFDSSCDGWQFNGQVTASTTHECASGSLHVAADNTDDIEASVSVESPSFPHSLRVAARISISEWNPGRVFRIESDGAVVAQLLVASLGANAGVKMAMCNEAATCASGTVDWKPSEEHLVVIESAIGGTKWSVDCVDLGSIPAVPLAVGTNKKTLLTFGRNDAQAIDGTIDDVSVTFRF